jgi:hypothetical protein
MKEMFSISTGVNVAKAKPATKGDQEISNNSDKTSSKDFLSIMFAQIKSSIAVEDKGKLDLEFINSKKSVNTDLDTKGNKKSIDEHLLEDLLKVVSIVKNPEAEISSFPSLSNKFEKLINNDTARKELKGINNITDLLNLSKKYDLGLEKISVKNLDLKNLEKEFPDLAKKDFFIDNKKEKTTKTLNEPKKEMDIKPTVLSINNIENSKIETKKEPTLLEKIMYAPKEEKKESTIQIDKEKVIQDKKEHTAIKTTEETKKTINTVQEEAPKFTIKEDSKKIVKKEESPKIEIKENSTKTAMKEEQKEIKTQTKENQHIKAEEEIKKPNSTRTNEVKIELNNSKKSMIENILQSIKPEKKDSITTQILDSTKIDNTKIDDKRKENIEVKTEPTTNRVEIKPQIKTDTLSSKQLSSTKDTFNNFATDFKEKLENYKPPFMKVQLALNPKGLGEVDVTIVNRGNNLHVNISSNANTMSLFTQNQAEFKNSLVNMGFTNLEMNFSDQRESKEQQGKSSKNFLGEFEDENFEDETTSIELIVPTYI